MAFTLDKWGPKRLRAIFKTIETEINSIRPSAGLGIDVDVTESGSQISTKNETPPGGADKEGTRGGGGGSGTSVNVYGAFNGAAATFHFLQSSPPTPS